MYSNVVTAIDKILRSYYVSTGGGVQAESGKEGGDEPHAQVPASVKMSVSEARLRWLTELIFQIGHSMGILECQQRPPGLQMWWTNTLLV